MLAGIHIIYIPRTGNLVMRNQRFLYQVHQEFKKNRHDFYFLKYFRGCSVIKTFHPQKKILLDIRTSGIQRSKLSRALYNFLLKTEAKFFKHSSVISKSLARKLNLPGNTFILPLGADIISSSQKQFESMHLLYVGTFRYRNIDQTVKGFSRFYHLYKDKIPLKYTIVGNGFASEEKLIKKIIAHQKIEKAVTFAGKIPHDQLETFFNSHNLGVSYIPVTDYFDVQPATKNFEYLLSGMPVIATNTMENSMVIHNKNGIIVKDTPDDFFQGLVRFYNRRKTYDSDKIRCNAKQYTWKGIVDNLKLMILFLIDSDYNKDNRIY